MVGNKEELVNLPGCAWWLHTMIVNWHSLLLGEKCQGWGQKWSERCSVGPREAHAFQMSQTAHETVRKDMSYVLSAL